MEIIINFKNYKAGKNVLELAEKIQKHLPKAVVAVPAVSIYEVSKNTKLKVYSQHIDSVVSGRGTGFVSPESVKASGGRGTLLNHSEHPLNFGDLKKTLKLAGGLKCVVCAKNLAEVKKIKNLMPYAIALEDPKLIGTGKSVTKYSPKAIEKFVKTLKGSGIKPICGAGISTAQDVQKAKELGCEGVLIASAVAKSRNPEKLLKELRKIN